MWRKGNTLALLAGMQIDIATMGINMEISLKTRNKTTITCLVAQSCLILCNPMDYSLPASSVHRDSPGKNTEVGCHALLQGIFSTQWSNPGLLHCRWILYQLSYEGSPRSHHQIQSHLDNLCYLLGDYFLLFNRYAVFSHSVMSNSLRPHGL